MIKKIPPSAFIGANVRELAFYKYFLNLDSDYAAKQVIEAQLDGLNSAGVRIVRLAASYAGCSAAECAEWLLLVLEALAERRMYAILCLDDSAMDGGTFIAGTEAFHTAAQGHLATQSFYGSRSGASYRKLYLQHAGEIVQKTHGHSATLLYELGNEFTIHASGVASRADSEAFLDFCRTTTQALRQISPICIASGLVCARHAYHDLADRAGLKQFAQRLYSHFDAISLHYDNHDFAHNGLQTMLPITMSEEIQFERALAREMNIPCYVGSIGAYAGDSSRVGWLAQQAEEWCAETNALGVFVASVNTLAELGALADGRGVSNGRDGDFQAMMKVIRNKRSCHDPLCPDLLTTARRERAALAVQPLPSRRPPINGQETGMSAGLA